MKILNLDFISAISQFLKISNVSNTELLLVWFTAVLVLGFLVRTVTMIFFFSFFKETCFIISLYFNENHGKHTTFNK